LSRLNRLYHACAPYVTLHCLYVTPAPIMSHALALVICQVTQWLLWDFLSKK
jgi:hypothetical protein